MDLRLPPIFLLGTRLNAEELQKWEDKISSLTRDVRQAEFIVGKGELPRFTTSAWVMKAKFEPM